MKLTTYIASITAALAIAGPAFCQTNWGSTGVVTVALTLTYESEALQLKDEAGKVLTAANGGGPTFENTYTVETLSGGPVDERVPIKSVTTTEYGSKLAVWKWGNADIIKLLVEDGTLPEIGKSPFLAGWSIVMTFDGEGIPTDIVARHTNKTTVSIDFTISESELYVGAIFDAISSKTVVTNNMPLTGDPSTTETRTLTNSYKGPATASVPFVLDSPLEVSGLLTGGLKVTAKTEGTGIDKITTFVYSNNASKLDKVLGVSTLDDLVEGSISVAAGVIVDLDAFNTPPSL
jgi:hypothetical protein